MWCVGALDAEYIRRMEDLLDLYARPVNTKEPVVCLDEKPVMLRGDSRSFIPCKPGRPARRDYEYVRHGKANRFCAVSPRQGKHILRVTDSRSAARFAEMLFEINRQYRTAKRIHLVVDNLNTHFEKSIIKRFGVSMGRRLWGRFKVHYTPKHASWLNQAEIAIGMYANECLRKRRIPSIEALTTETLAYERRANAEQRTINWRFTKQRARKKFKYFTPSL
jgi:hypothetical protein